MSNYHLIKKVIDNLSTSHVSLIFYYNENHIQKAICAEEYSVLHLPNRSEHGMNYK